MNLARYKTILSLVFIVVFAMMMSPVMAKVGDPCTNATIKVDCGSGERCSPDLKCVGTFGVTEIADADLALGGDAEGSSLIKTATQIINVALGLLGIVAVVIILIGGFKWMTAGGNDEGVTEARKLIFSGIIGIAIILSAWAIARFVLVQLGEATGTPGIDVYSTPDTTE